MAFALVTHIEAGSADGAVVTSGGIDTTGADLLVCAVAGTDGITASPTDSKSNTWITTTPSTQAFGETVTIFYAKNPTVGAAHTFSVIGGFRPVVCVAAFSGAHLTGPLDQQAQAGGYPGPITLASKTPASDGALVVSAVAFNTASVMSEISGPGGVAGLTITGQIQKSTNTIGAGLAYVIQTTAAAIAPKWDGTNDTNMATTMAIFHNAAGGGGGIPPGGGTTGSTPPACVSTGGF